MDRGDTTLARADSTPQFHSPKHPEGLISHHQTGTSPAGGAGSASSSFPKPSSDPDLTRAPRPARADRVKGNRGWERFLPSCPPGGCISRCFFFFFLLVFFWVFFWHPWKRRGGTGGSSPSAGTRWHHRGWPVASGYLWHEEHKSLSRCFPSLEQRW